MSPFDDLIYILNAVLLGEKPTIENFILLTGTIVAFVAFILWCCFPIVPKGNLSHYDPRGYKYRKSKMMNTNDLLQRRMNPSIHIIQWFKEIYNQFTGNLSYRRQFLLGNRRYPKPFSPQ